ncbi:uncharacterized protein BO88DRAFT_491542 [Aspergillus vadensis CBS 113365]|uniref:Uncharacterized protein n=1 Tax=Aspergillus vadensis (strain CBS 113365 / IMI 142717 / IBT 24658) TaxID=1448311 RepID=A0A319AX86_ASPVC|nr:hypothetical protein BO88DRAFT_491542 [Aspergillus vadensis CBS 113365]PYH64365.1 hypothetical protein BO88DRAFT_491542 [Aspergillus vadensis CBS 113365]
MSHTVGLVVQERVAPTASTPETDTKAPHPRGVEAIHRSRYPFAAETNDDANESKLAVIGFYPAFSSTAKKATVDPDLKLAPLSKTAEFVCPLRPGLALMLLERAEAWGTELRALSDPGCSGINPSHTGGHRKFTIVEVLIDYYHVVSRGASSLETDESARCYILQTSFKYLLT